MHDGFKRWIRLGALAAASGWMVACGALPQQAGNESYNPGFVRSPEQAGYNGTIQDIPTSIDPRTPEAQGTPGRSLLLDPGERALLEALGEGSRDDGSIYGGSGSEGAAPIPTEGDRRR